MQRFRRAQGTGKTMAQPHRAGLLGQAAGTPWWFDPDPWGW